jgi:hypothetical protein
MVTTSQHLLLPDAPRRSALLRALWWLAFPFRLFFAVLAFGLVGGVLSEAFYDGQTLSGWAFCAALLAAWFVSPFRLIHPYLRLRRWLKRRETIAAWNRHQDELARQQADWFDGQRRTQASADAYWRQHWAHTGRPSADDPYGDYAEREPVRADRGA